VPALTYLDDRRVCDLNTRSVVSVCRNSVARLPSEREQRQPDAYSNSYGKITKHIDRQLRC
jgi:hypothetical protein